MIGRAITLVESTRLDHQELAQDLLVRLLPHSGNAHRVGITGVPGVGKSTFIDALGMDLIAAGRRVAVLAVDPSSSRTGGSILGDKTRMERLAVDPQAFIRASPTSGTLGGVTRATREAIVVLEAAGHDVMLVETPAAFVRNYKLQLKAASTDTVQGWVQLDGATAGSTVQLRIPEAGIQKAFSVDDSGRAEFEFDAGVGVYGV